MNRFRLRFDDIQPSQLYISRTKYVEVLKHFDLGLEPIPIKELDGKLVSTDGHTRSVAWILKGFKEVECEWEDTELNWDAYRVCVKWCREVGIKSMYDLQDRFLDHSQYEVLWLERCRVMQEDLQRQGI